ncbi:hypothetical protein [Schlesneria sp. T3-172]|uniref:hypothetical protein n=1 Tax=Schlesneria sphaerica TaxID=3373610 RepID=UPI0037C5000E
MEATIMTQNNVIGKTKISHDGQEYLDTRNRAAHQAAALKARAAEIEAGVSICDQVYCQLLASDCGNNAWLALSVAVNSLQSKLEA